MPRAPIEPTKFVRTPARFGLRKSDFSNEDGVDLRTREISRSDKLQIIGFSSSTPMNVAQPNLRQNFQEIARAPSYRAWHHKVRRQEYFLGKPVHYGIWNPSYQDRFFDKTDVKYVNDVHEYPIFPSEPGRIHEPILHWPDFNIEKFLDKMNRYSSIEALDRYKQGKRTNWFRMIAAFPAIFLKNYFYYSGLPRRNSRLRHLDLRRNFFSSCKACERSGEFNRGSKKRHETFGFFHYPKRREVRLSFP